MNCCNLSIECCQGNFRPLWLFQWLKRQFYLWTEHAYNECVRLLVVRWLYVHLYGLILCCNRGLGGEMWKQRLIWWQLIDGKSHLYTRLYWDDIYVGLPKLPLIPKADRLLTGLGVIRVPSSFAVVWVSNWCLCWSPLGVAQPYCL